MSRKVSSVEEIVERYRMQPDPDLVDGVEYCELVIMRQPRGKNRRPVSWSTPIKVPLAEDESVIRECLVDFAYSLRMAQRRGKEQLLATRVWVEQRRVVERITATDWVEVEQIGGTG